MPPLEPKPPDPSHPASYFLSWHLPCTSLPKFCQQLTEFYASIVSSESSLADRSGSLRLTGCLQMEPPLFLYFGPQVSVLISLAPLHLVLLLSPFGELGLDLHIMGMDLQLACRFAHYGISPFDASLVGAHWMHICESITLALHTLPRSLFMLSLCLSMAFWFGPYTVILFDLWFVLHICLSRGCVSHGFHYDYAT